MNSPLPLNCLWYVQQSWRRQTLTRPVANIPSLAKVTEKVAAAQTHSYLEKNLLMHSMQSAYHKHHSTETDLLWVTSNVLRTIDRRQDVVLIMLDLSAAFDTLDHIILVPGRLSSYFRFYHTVLKCFPW